MVRSDVSHEAKILPFPPHVVPVDAGFSLIDGAIFRCVVLSDGGGVRHPAGGRRRLYGEVELPSGLSRIEKLGRDDSWSPTEQCDSTGLLFGISREVAEPW